jgi:hypothetical protein
MPLQSRSPRARYKRAAIGLAVDESDGEAAQTGWSTAPDLVPEVWAIAVAAAPAAFFRPVTSGPKGSSCRPRLRRSR